MYQPMPKRPWWGGLTMPKQPIRAEATALVLLAVLIILPIVVLAVR